MLRTGSRHQDNQDRHEPPTAKAYHTVDDGKPAGRCILRHQQYLGTGTWARRISKLQSAEPWTPPEGCREDPPELYEGGCCRLPCFQLFFSRYKDPADTMVAGMSFVLGFRTVHFFMWPFGPLAMVSCAVVWSSRMHACIRTRTSNMYMYVYIRMYIYIYIYGTPPKDLPNSMLLETLLATFAPIILWRGNLPCFE